MTEFYKVSDDTIRGIGQSTADVTTSHLMALSNCSEANKTASFLVVSSDIPGFRLPKVRKPTREGDATMRVTQPIANATGEGSQVGRAEQMS